MYIDMCIYIYRYVCINTAIMWDVRCRVPPLPAWPLRFVGASRDDPETWPLHAYGSFQTSGVYILGAVKELTKLR